MYHYTNQSIYNHDVYHQCPVPDLTKTHIETANSVVMNNVVVQNEFKSISQNLSAVNTLDVGHGTGAPAELQENKTNKKKEKPEKPAKKSIVDTSNFTIEERLVAAVWVHERNRTFVGMSEIKRDFQQRFGREPPAKNTLLAWERKLFATGSVHDAPRTGRPVNRLKRLQEVVESLRAAPALSVRARARALRLPPSTLRALLRTDLPAPAPAPAPTHHTQTSTPPKPTRQSKKKARAVLPAAAAPAPAPPPYGE